MFPNDPDAPFDPYFIETRDTVLKYAPSCLTRDVFQDKNGIYWFATWQGIIRYDGKEFINMTLKEGLIHFHVALVAGDKAGNIWFGTVRGGLYRYNGKSFQLFTTKDGLADNSVQCMLDDKDGNIWFGSNHGLSRYDGKSFINFIGQDIFKDISVNSIIQDKNGRLWFGTENGIFCTNPHTNSIENKQKFISFKNRDSLAFKNTTSLLEDQCGNIWIGTMNGLYCYDPSVKVGAAITNPLPNFVYYIIKDTKGDIWLTASESNIHYPDLPRQVLYRYENSLLNFSVQAKNFIEVTEKYDSGDCQVFGKIVDKSGYLWFGTMKGPCRYDPSAKEGDPKAFNYFRE